MLCLQLDVVHSLMCISLIRPMVLMSGFTLYGFLNCYINQSDLLSNIEATLTVANLCSVLEEVEEWESLSYYLDVPGSIQREIKKKSNEKECKQAMLEEWRKHHPAPSWMLVADALYRVPIRGEYGKYHEVLLLVKEKYLKGKINCVFLSSHCVIETCPLLIIPLY